MSNCGEKTAAGTFALLLNRMRQLSDVPLQSGINGPAIVRSAWLAGGSMGGAYEPASLPSTLDELVEEALADRRAQPCDGRTTSAAPEAPAAATPLDEATLETLSQWVERVFSTIRNVHKRAIDVLALRANGLSDREIARQLGLGLRLVQRMVDDIRAAWRAA